MKVITENTVLDNEEVACDETIQTHVIRGESSSDGDRTCLLHVAAASGPLGDVVDIKMTAMWNET
jgi:hypothetical protein